MRERLEEREEAGDRLAGGRKDAQRRGVGIEGSVPDRSGHGAQPRLVVLRDLAGAAGRIVDHVLVTGKHERGAELDHPFERGEVVAEGVGARQQIQRDARRDPGQQDVAGRKDAAPLEGEMAGCVAGEMVDPPPSISSPRSTRIGSGWNPTCEKTRRLTARAFSPSSAGKP